MTFDQLQRYRLAGGIIDALRPRRPLRILDAGSREGFLRSFLPDDAIVNLDREYFAGTSLVLGDVLALPFPSAAFDAVVSLDVLEHIPPARRPAFLDELARVSAGLIVLSAPCAGEEVVAAEKLVNDFCLRVTGQENAFLADHLSSGLPREEEVLGWAKKRGFPSAVIPNAYLPRWAAMMCLNSYLASLPDPWELIFRVNEMYDREFSALDNRSPAYRRFIVLSRTSALDADGLRRSFSSIETSDRAESEAWAFLGRMAEAVAAGQREKIGRLEEQRADLERQNQRREKEIRDLAMLVEKHALAADGLRREKDAEAGKLVAHIERQSGEIRQLTAALSSADAELEKIRNSQAFKIYRATLGRLKKGPK
jgi:hypothetical protein